MAWERNSVILLHAEVERLFDIERKMSQDRGAWSVWYVWITVGSSVWLW